MAQPSQNPAPDRPAGPSGETETVVDGSGSAAPTISFPAPEPWPTIPGYEIQSEVGRGGMGVVYRAVEQSSGRVRALKVIAGPQVDPAALERFRREHVIQTNLPAHPGLLRVYECGVYRRDSDGAVLPFYAMDLVDGPGGAPRTLARDLRVNPRPPRDRIEQIIKVCDAVQTASQHGVQHRDLKPQNILLTSTGEPVVMDFGVARATGVETSTREFLAGAGRPAGTPLYMAPEQASAETVLLSHACDVYSLGIMLHEAISGQPPYDVAPESAQTLASAITAAATHARPLDVPAPTPRDPRRREPVDRRIASIVRKATHLDPAQRYQNAGELAAALRGYLRRTRWFAARRRIAGVPAAPALIAGMAATCFAAALLVGALMTLRLIPIPGVSDWYEPERISAMLPAALDRVRIIAITDDTDVAALARAAMPEGPPVTPSRMFPMRAVHGELCKLLIPARPAAVGFDLLFAPNEAAAAHDARLAEGIRAMRQAGIEVVVGSQRWDRDPVTRLPMDVSRVVAQASQRWGGVTIVQSDPAWGIDMWFLDAGLGRVEPSFASEMYAAVRAPGERYDAVVHRATSTVEMEFWRPIAEIDGGRARTGRTVTWRLSTPLPGESGGDDNRLTGFERGDSSLALVVELPPQETLDAIVVPLHEALAASDAQRRAWFEGKAVIVGDHRGTIDAKTRPDGGRVYGPQVQAVAVAASLAGLIPRVATVAQHAQLSFAAALGAAILVAIFARGRGPAPQAIALLVAAAMVGAGFAAAWALAQKEALLFDPVGPALAVLIAVVSASTLRAHAVRVSALATSRLTNRPSI